MLACTIMKRSLDWDSGNGGHLCHKCAVWPWARYSSSLAFIDSSVIGRGWWNDLDESPLIRSIFQTNNQTNQSILHLAVGRNLGLLKWWKKNGEPGNIRCVGASNLDHYIVGNEELLERRLQGSRACFCLGSFFSPSHRPPHPMLNIRQLLWRVGTVPLMQTEGLFYPHISHLLDVHSEWKFKLWSQTYIDLKSSSASNKLCILAKPLHFLFWTMENKSCIKWW